MARPQSRRQGRGVRGEPAQIQGQLEARLRQFRRRLSRRVFAPLAARDGEPAQGRGHRKGHVLLQEDAGRAADVHPVHGQRPPLQGQAAEPGEKRPADLWAIEVLAPGMEHVAEKLRANFGERAESLLDLAGSEPVNINVFPNLSLLGNHIQVFEPVSVDETNVIWYGTEIDDVDGSIGADA